MFITFEGIEGAGKSTQAKRLAERLRAQGYAVQLTREPGGTPLANAIRAVLLHPEVSLRALEAAQLIPPGEPTEPSEPMLPVTELLLLAAARAQHVARIRGWLATGAIVLSDRYADATHAYQGAARGLGEATIAALEQLATGGLRPDLTLLLDLPVTEGLGRKRAQAGEWNRLDAEEHAFHERVRAGYEALAAREPQRWVMLDATQPPDVLAEQVWQAVQTRLPSQTGGSR